MPIYEYVCRSCEHEFEELSRTMSDEKVRRCPACRSTSVERRLSVFAARQGTSSPADLPGGGPCAACDESNGSCPWSM